MMWRTCFVVLACLLTLVTGAQAESPSAARVESLLHEYVEGFFSPATDLAYGIRINGPRGIEVLESPAEIAAKRVRGEFKPWGYGAGIEDVAYQNGMLLFALCDAEEATGNACFAELARRIFRGMRRIGTLSPVPGFIPRGPHPDGKSYYPDSSRDQHTLFVCGLWRYARSRLASPSEKDWIREVTLQVVRRLEKNGWSILSEDGSVEAHAGGSILSRTSADAAILLLMLATAYDLTGDAHWKSLYDQFGQEEDGLRWRLLDEEIDPTQPGRWDLFSNQDAFRTETLRRATANAEHKTILRRRVVRMADDMLTSPYFLSWRRLPWTTPPDDAEANAFLKPLGLTVDSKATVMDLWQKAGVPAKSPDVPGRMRHRYDYMTMTSPFEAWQVALLSQSPQRVRQARDGVCQMLQRVDFGSLNSGWSTNYAMTAALWALVPTR